MNTQSFSFHDVELLSQEEFHELLPRAQEGDDEALERLVKGNLRLVMSIAMRFHGMGYDLEDLFQIGSMGLMKALKRFDPSYEVKFSTYAVPLIIGEIRQFLRDSGPIRVSRSLKELARQAYKVGEELSIELGREASVTEIAEKLNVSKEDIIQAIEATRPVASLNEPIYGSDNEDKSVIDLVVATESLEPALLERLALDEAMEALPERERRILKLRFFDEKPQAEVARITGLSQAQVSRVERKALMTLRERLGSI
jgi:RNA polymerase sporulation-specific sigma factor